MTTNAEQNVFNSDLIDRFYVIILLKFMYLYYCILYFDYNLVMIIKVFD